MSLPVDALSPKEMLMVFGQKQKNHSSKQEKVRGPWTLLYYQQKTANEEKRTTSWRIHQPILSKFGVAIVTSSG